MGSSSCELRGNGEGTDFSVLMGFSMLLALDFLRSSFTCEVGFKSSPSFDGVDVGFLVVDPSPR